MKQVFSTACMAALLGLSAHVYAGAQNNNIDAKIEAAMVDEARPEKDRVRDANRKPLETLEFFGLQDDMTVVELIPGGGWYTRILAPTLFDNGELYLLYGTGWLGDLLKNPGFEKVKIAAPEHKMYRPEGAPFYVLEKPQTDLKNIDMVLTFRNYHNFDESSRKAINDEVYKMLKIGGIYGLVDHTRRHMEPFSEDNRRRADPVLAIKEIQDAGFELVDFSDLHYRPADNLKHEVGHKDVTGQTDRWTLKFRKVTK